MESYIDEDYYYDTYGGDLIPQKEFDKIAAKASNYVRLRILDKDITEFETAVKNVTCEVAEIIYNQNQLKNNYQKMLESISSGSGSAGMITSEKVGDYSVSKASLSMNELKELCSNEELESQINNKIESALLLTGLLYQGIGFNRNV